VNEHIESAGLRIIAQKRLQLTLKQTQKFYAIHQERSFFYDLCASNDLCASMIADPVVLQILEGENAITHYRTIMGATNPANAEEGTIRRDFAESIEANSVHGSDSLASAATEIPFFFSEVEIVG
jgi:nucleoside-diphosphate kinase